MICHDTAGPDRSLYNILTDAQQFPSSASTCHGKTFSASWWAAACHGWLSNSKLVYVLVAMELCFKGGF